MLAEKGGKTLEEVAPAPGFRLAATMNPGGDYGKRELSPALVNRFTCIWVPPLSDVAELAAIVEARLEGTALLLVKPQVCNPGLVSCAVVCGRSAMRSLVS